MLAKAAYLWSGSKAAMLRARRHVPLLSLGVALARRGVMPVIALAISAGTVVAVSLLAVVLSRRGANAPVHTIPLLASSALAWGGGFLQAFAVAAHALRRDKTDGVRQLIVARTTTLRGYVAARVGGLGVALAAVVGGGTLLSSAVAVCAAARLGAVPKTLQATVAALVFSLAFAAVIAPVAFAALGARTRLGGYLFLIGVVIVPEIIVESIGGAVPESFAELLSIPSALGAVRAALAPGSFDPFRAARALAALAIFSGLAFHLVRRDAERIDGPDDPHGERRGAR